MALSEVCRDISRDSHSLFLCSAQWSSMQHKGTFIRGEIAVAKPAMAELAGTCQGVLSIRAIPEKPSAMSGRSNLTTRIDIHKNAMTNFLANSYLSRAVSAMHASSKDTFRG